MPRAASLPDERLRCAMVPESESRGWFADGGAPWLDALCEKESSTPDSIWEDLCRARGVEPCSVPEFLMTRRA
jgi:hypothetical protein